MFFSSKKSGAVDFIIVGLGNPGSKYENTRHNAGFIVAEALAKRLGADISTKKHSARCTTVDLAGKKCLLMKPQTFMNESGVAVSDAARFYKLPSEKIIVVFDDISLEPGRLRIRRKGSDGGHNGIRSISAHIGADFPRIKVGVGEKPHPDYDLAAWVLSKFKDDELKLINEAALHACDALELMVAGDIDRAMNKFN